MWRLRRNRRELGLARSCQGLRMPAKSSRFFNRATTHTEPAVAASFSSTVLEYSAGEHLCRDISRVRQAIFSQDASTSPVSINGAYLARLRFLIGQTRASRRTAMCSVGARSS